MPIFDQGYQHWNGSTSGHAWRWLTVARHGLRTGLKGKLVRLMLLASCVPALALILVLCLWGLLERQSETIKPFIEVLSLIGGQAVSEPRTYRTEIWTLCFHYFLRGQLFFAMVIVAMVGPNLISQDLRFNALPLYFSRPMRRIDYFLGKLGVIFAFLAMVVILPAVAAWIMGLAFSLDISIVADTWRLLLSSVVYGLLVAVSAGGLVLALSSLSRNSRYIALAWLGIWIISGILSTILTTVAREQRWHAHRAEMVELSRPATTPTAPGARAPRTNWQAMRAARLEFELREIQRSSTDWRPMVSYTANLARLGSVLTGADACWQTLAQLRPERERQQFLANNVGPQYPWYWSLGVLVALLGLSAWILNYRVKSLDRLR